MKIYYSVEDCGDGSAYPRFFKDEKVAEFHQENLTEGWGEPCTGSVEPDDAISMDEYLADLLVSNSDNLEKYLSEFYLLQAPKVEVIVGHNNKYNVHVDGFLAKRIYAYGKDAPNEKAALELQNKYNKRIRNCYVPD